MSECNDIISDCTNALMTAAKQEDIEESKQLKARIRDAAGNKEIFEIRTQVIGARLQQLKQERALSLCGPEPKLPYGMDPITFAQLMRHIYEGTTDVIIGNPNSINGKKIKTQIKNIINSNPCLKKHTKIR